MNYIEVEGVNARAIIIALVNYIRSHQDCTFNQLVTAAETAYPNLNWKVDKIIEWIKNKLEAHYGFVPTFTQFKTYVINHKFSGVDDG